MDVKLAVAENLRNIRLMRKLSLDSAAQLTGVSKSMLGQIERGEVNPTLSVCWRIANGLRVSFTALIEPPPSCAQIQAFDKMKPFVDDDGRYHNYPVFAFDADRGFEQYRILMEPGCMLDAGPHMAGTEEYLLVFGGRLTVTADGTAYTLQKGDGLRFRADVPHRYENTGDTPVELSMVIRYTSIKGEQHEDSIHSP